MLDDRHTAKALSGWMDSRAAGQADETGGGMFGCRPQHSLTILTGPDR